jgi:hypothetical protein
LAGADPYVIEPEHEIPEWRSDFNQRYPGISRVTVAPTTLLFYVPFASLSHRTQQVIWWLLQWAAMIWAIIVLYRSEATEEERRAFLSISVVCFLGSWFWRLHVERGQYYVFLTLLLCLDLAAIRAAGGSRPRWVGIPIGISIALRPTYGIVLPLLWLLGERRAAVRAAVTSVLLVALSIAVVGWSAWRHFFETVEQMAIVEVDPGFQARHFGPLVTKVPPLIEGLDFSKELPHRGGGSTIAALIKAPWALPLSRAATFAVGFVGIALAWWMSARGIRRDAILMLVSLIPIFIEFTGTTRNTYADVAFLPVVAFMVAIMPASVFVWILACITLLLFIGPLESKWTVHLRHLMIVTLATAVLCQALMPANRAKPVASGQKRSAAPLSQ